MRWVTSESACRRRRRRPVRRHRAPAHRQPKPTQATPHPTAPGAGTHNVTQTPRCSNSTPHTDAGERRPGARPAPRRRRGAARCSLPPFRRRRRAAPAAGGRASRVATTAAPLCAAFSGAGSGSASPARGRDDQPDDARGGRYKARAPLVRRARACEPAAHRPRHTAHPQAPATHSSPSPGQLVTPSSAWSAGGSPQRTPTAAAVGPHARAGALAHTRAGAHVATAPAGACRHPLPLGTRTVG
jgi:hypothetical protein